MQLGKMFDKNKELEKENTEMLGKILINEQILNEKNK